MFCGGISSHERELKLACSHITSTPKTRSFSLPQSLNYGPSPLDLKRVACSVDIIPPPFLRKGLDEAIWSEDLCAARYITHTHKLTRGILAPRLERAVD